MAKTLIIAEKSSVAADIAKALGGFGKSDTVYERDDVIIASAQGHLVELDVPEAEGIKGLAALPVIPHEFGLRVIDETRSKFQVLDRLLRSPDVGTVVNACDAGREGELIFRLIVEKAGCMKPIKRMWFRSMTPDALLQAYADLRPGEDYERVRDAAKCRSEADWLIGINGTRGLSALREHQTGKYEVMNAGRVQTPTLALPVHRELEIRTFVSQNFWEVVANFGVAAGHYKGKWHRSKDAAGSTPEVEGEGATRFFEREQAHALTQRCLGQPVESVTDVVTPGRHAPPKLFDLTTLQREANKRFKLPVKKTLDIAQRLYETHKMATYPRTDSSALPEDYVNKVRDTVRELENSEWGRLAKQVTDSEWIKPNKRIFDNSKISDHFAIIPTGVLSDKLDPDERRVFDLIVRRFLAAFFPDVEYETTKRTTVIAGESFHTSGKVITSKGWNAVMQDVADEGEAKKDDDGSLCVLQEGEVPSNEGVIAVAGKTTPPSRFTEASLLGAMETAGNAVDDDELRAAMKDKGLGTPATRANTIEGLLNDRDGRGHHKEPYLVRKEGFLVPTPKAMGTIGFLDGSEARFLASAQTTGEWEEKLNRMERGEYARDVFMEEIKRTTVGLIEILRTESAKAPKVEAVVQKLVARCPKCGQEVKLSQWYFECASACGFKVNRELCSRPIKEAEMEQILGGKTLLGLQGFVSPKTKKKFDAGLRLSADFRLDFVFDSGGGVNSATGQDQGDVVHAAPDKRLACMCPKCENIIASKPALVACTKCDFKVWREQFGRKFKDAELDKLIYKGEVKSLDGFVSRGSGNMYSAGVKLDKSTGKMELVFADRR